MQVLSWGYAAVVSALIIASRKHYTVDVVIAWYTVPLVFYFLMRRWRITRQVGDTAAAQGRYLKSPKPGAVVPGPARSLQLDNGQGPMDGAVTGIQVGGSCWGGSLGLRTGS